jgi:hypothetical protein
MSVLELYRRWIDELWCGRTEVAPELVGEDFVGHWPRQTVRGVAGLTELISQTHAMLEPLSFAIEVGPFGQGELVAGRWRGRGRQDGAEVEFVGNDILRVEDAKFVEYWVASAPLS